MPNLSAASWTLAASTSLAAALVLLAGSDLPPPVGFIWVATGAVAAGALVRALVPPVLGLRHTIGMLRTFVAVVGAVSAAAISATAIFSAAMSRRQLAVLVAAAPGAAVSLLALSVIGTRLVT